MPVRTELSDKWVRAYVGDTAVVDSRAPVLCYEAEFPVPGYAFARTDVRTDLLEPSSGEPPSEPFFFLPLGPVAQWFDLDVDGRRIDHAAWIRDDPATRDLLVFSWQPGLIDRWLEEEEEVAGHPRDPHKRVEAIASSRHIAVALNGVLLADSRNPVLLFETDLPTRYYVPREDVNIDALSPSTNHSLCPYKGVASADSQPRATSPGRMRSPFPRWARSRTRSPSTTSWWTSRSMTCRSSVRSRCSARRRIVRPERVRVLD